MASLFVVNSILEDNSDDTMDLQYFDLKTSSKRRYSGIWKDGICQGSWECPNPHCTFKALSLNNQLNRVSWLNVKGYKNLKICDSCRCVVKRQVCGARKFTNFNPQTYLAHVYHMGTHTYTPIWRHAEKRSAWPKYFRMWIPRQISLARKYLLTRWKRSSKLAP